MEKLEKYYKALNRLIQNNPNIVSKDTKISYDSVSLEAGMSKGCIKKSRPGFSELIEAIDKHKLNKNMHWVMTTKNESRNFGIKETT